MISESKRMLAAVMFTDIVGYTSMMHSDEDSARKKVRRHRQVVEEEHKKYEGQIHSDSKDYLPKIFTSFLGRRKEIDEIRVLLQRNKLITLTGPGGTGKTRLSIEVANEVKSDFQDGIFWVPLTSVKDSNTVVMAIVEHLDSGNRNIFS